MIYDKIENIDNYKFLGIVKNNSNKFQKGKFDIAGDIFFGIGLEYETKDKSDCLWEAHQRYLDIHVIHEGEEVIFVSERNNMEVSKEHDDENDYALFTGIKEHSIVLKKGFFLALYPNEVHKTSIKNGGDVSAVKKTVFKYDLNSI